MSKIETVKEVISLAVFLNFIIDSFIQFFKNPMVIKVAKLVMWVLFIIIIIGLVRKTLKKRMDRISVIYKIQKGRVRRALLNSKLDY